MRAYLYSESLLLTILRQHHPDSKLIQKACAYAWDNEDQLNQHECITIIKLALELDLSVYVQELISYTLPDSNTLINHKNLSHFCGIIQHELNEESALILNNIIYAAYNKKPQAYIDNVKRVVGSLMTKKELYAYHNEFRLTSSDDEILSEILDMSTFLMKKMV